MNKNRKIKCIVILAFIFAVLTSCSKAEKNKKQAELSESVTTGISSDSSENLFEADAQSSSSAPAEFPDTETPVDSAAGKIYENSKKYSFVYDVSPEYTWEEAIRRDEFTPLYRYYISHYLNGESVINGKSAKVKSGKISDFEYSVYENGKASIDKYTGKDKHVVVPGNVDGYEVFAVNHDALCGDNYFGNITLESVEFPDSVLFLLDGVCEKCYSLKEVKLPENLILIGGGCFNSCWALTEITFGDNLREIGTSAFYWCMNLSKVNFGSNLTVIEGNTFAECYKLRSLRLPDTVKYIGPDSFIFSRNLRDVNCPKSLEILYKDAFDATKIDVDTFNTKNIRLIDDTNSDYEQHQYVELKTKQLYQ